ncbi:GNAT family N-acetyltransferase [Caldicellulosiruptor morganii]|uniref:GNAT family N-acetyltransferase n=1 Tax=Caldicellulosiruptor morganii TaxID=1387555 RepID=A0ABY7BNT2_9FIRM|nr:GNAT family protein [Caldicellulosiruptor morganii]WAM34488.1 GNAT family N-acetyltransferase [Caldicellulosiruptor morganii]
MLIAKGDLVNIRELRWGDLKYLQKWSNDPEVAFWARGVKDVSYTSAGEFRRWYYSRSNSSIKRFIVETKDKKPIGSISYRDYDPVNKVVVLGIHIGEKEYWGKGFGTDAIKAFVKYLFATLDINRIELDTFDDNIRAIKAYQKCGFKIEGVLREARFIDGKFHDVIIMGMIRKDFEKIANRTQI